MRLDVPRAAGALAVVCPEAGFFSPKGGYENVLMLVASAIALTFIGPGLRGPHVPRKAEPAALASLPASRGSRGINPPLWTLTFA